MPKFSIVVPIYKVEKYLRQCIESILCQLYKNFELILVDDGSPDKCGEICDEYAKKDERVKVIHKKNGGLADARNFGINKSTGDYIIFVDGDDFWIKNDFLQQIDQKTKNNNIDMVIWRYTPLYDSSNTLGEPLSEFDLSKIDKGSFEEVFDYLIRSSYFTTSAWTKAIKRDLIIKNNIFFEKGLLREDIDWGINLILHINSLEAINYPMYAYRVRTDSLSKNISLKDCDDLYKTIIKWSNIVESSDISDNIKYNILGYLAFEYYILLGFVNSLDKVNRKTFFNKLKSLEWITNYDINYKTHKSKIIYKLLGIKMASKVFSFYIKHVKRK